MQAVRRSSRCHGLRGIRHPPRLGLPCLRFPRLDLPRLDLVGGAEPGIPVDLPSPDRRHQQRQKNDEAEEVDTIPRSLPHANNPALCNAAGMAERR